MSHYLHDLAFIARHYNALIANGQTPQQALTSLDIGLGESRARAWQVWQHLVDSQAHVLSVEGRDNFTQLLCRIKEHEGDMSRLPGAVERGIGTLVNNAQHVWMSLANTLFYFFAVMLVAIVCWAIYLLHILPSFKTFFLDIGAELPELTLNLLAVGEQAGQAVFAGALIVLLLVLLVVVRLHTKVQHLQPLTGPFLWLPGLRSLAGLHNQHVLAAGAVMVADTVDREHPLPLAADWLGMNLQRHVPQDTGGAWSDLLLADQLGTAAAELNHWLAVYPAYVQQQFTRLSRVMMAGLQTVALITVGLLLIAIYLPIFSIGNVLF